MADENRPNTRGRVDNRKDLDTYFKSEAFATLIKKSITEEFERFLSSEGFKDMLVSTTKSVVSEVVSGTVEAIIGNEVDKAIVYKLFINEDLTIANKVLFDRARKDLSHLAVWTIDGKVLVKLADDKIIRIKANEDIENLC